jgi:hypothetical protein
MKTTIVSVVVGLAVVFVLHEMLHIQQGGDPTVAIWSLEIAMFSAILVAFGVEHVAIFDKTSTVHHTPAVQVAKVVTLAFTASVVLYLTAYVVIRTVPDRRSKPNTIIDSNPG